MMLRPALPCTLCWESRACAALQGLTARHPPAQLTASLPTPPSSLALGLSGGVGAACFALLLAPQAFLNARRKTTEGLSLSLVVIWHLGSLLYAASLFASSASPWLLASMLSFSGMSSLLEAQVVAYKRSSRPALLLPALATVGIGASCLLAWLLGKALASLPAKTLHLFGDGVPAVLFALGFLPQLHMFLKTQSVAGYSFGVTVLDVLGSAANVFVVRRTGAGWSQALPFLTIIGFHGVLVAIAAWIVLFGTATNT